jgi:phosphoribosylanthranilate isomerase
MTIVKICGITRLADAKAAVEAGADMLGLNFYKRSPRYIEPADARQLCDALRVEYGGAVPVLVGIFVNEGVGTISQITNAVGLHAAQLSGDESENVLKELRGMAYKAIQPMNETMALDDVTYYAPTFPQKPILPSLLLDAYHPTLRGGTGDAASEAVAIAVRERVPRFLLAGGLTPENVADRVAAIQPWGVDVASGVEAEPGIKDAVKMADFITAAQSIDR